MTCVHGLGKETPTKSVIYWNSKWSLLIPKKSSWANWLQCIWGLSFWVFDLIENAKLCYKF